MIHDHSLDRSINVIKSRCCLVTCNHARADTIIHFSLLVINKSVVCISDSHKIVNCFWACVFVWVIYQGRSSEQSFQLHYVKIVTACTKYFIVILWQSGVGIVKGTDDAEDIEDGEKVS